MEIRHLKLVEAVAEEGSLSKAVDRLFLTQSALSHQLKELESHYGITLFHRVNKKLVLTGAGKIVLKSAKKILKEIEETEVEIKRLISGENGSIRLSTECYTCYHWIPPLLQQFKREFPNIEVRIYPEYTQNPLKELLNGKIDLAITDHPLDDNNISYREIFTDEQVAVVSKDHHWTGKDFVTPKDFADETLLVYSLPLESVTLYNRLLMPYNIKPKKIIPMQLTEATLEMIKAGMGVKVMAKWAIKPYLSNKNISTVKVTKNGLHRTWYAATLKKNEMPLYLDYFVEHLCLNCYLGDKEIKK